MAEQRKGRHRLSLILPAAAAAVAVLAGVVWALNYQGNDPANIAQERKNAVIIQRLVFGRLPEDYRGTPKASDFKEESSYTTTDRLGLRAITAGEKGKLWPFTLRLEDSKGQALPFAPASLSLPTGDAYYCCWQVSRPGLYTLRIFRPDGIISVFRLPVR